VRSSYLLRQRGAASNHIQFTYTSYSMQHYSGASQASGDARRVDGACEGVLSARRPGLRLHDAISEGGAAAVAALLASDEGCDVDEATSNGTTGLMKAAHSGREEVVKLLLAAGADPNRRDNTNGVSALILAASSGHVAIASLLLRSGADPAGLPDDAGRSPLLYASRRGHAELVELLLNHAVPSAAAAAPTPVPSPREEGATAAMICQGDEMGLAPLAGAAQNGHLQVVQRLLQRILRLSAQGSSGSDLTKESMASPHTASSLIIDRQDETGCSALHSACFRGHSGVVAALLAAGADASRRDGGDDGMDAAEWALEGGHEAIAAEVCRATAAAAPLPAAAT
jgi:ankyrin repeat protein